MPERVINTLRMEDNEVDVINVLQAFKKINIIDQIYLASEGLQALIIMLCGNDGQPPKVTAEQHLVFLDLHKPNISGSELSQELALRATPVIVMTTSNQDQHRLKADNLSLAKYILKPLPA